MESAHPVTNNRFIGYKVALFNMEVTARGIIKIEKSCIQDINK